MGSDEMATTGGRQWIELNGVRLQYDSAMKEVEILRDGDVQAAIPLDGYEGLEALRRWIDMLCRMEAAR